MTSDTRKTAWECYQLGIEEQKLCDEIQLGPWSSYSYKEDPKHLAFVLSRYKFCAKMLEGQKKVVEIGCGDGVGIPLVAQVVDHLHCIDWDEKNLEGCARRLRHLKNVSFEKIDLNHESLHLKADAAYSIDVIEHVEPELEKVFMDNLTAFLKHESILITGTPNITASPYASPRSEVQHINLKNQKTLKELHQAYFKHVFSFGMNDEVLHTGYHAMCHYIWAVAAEKK